MQLKPKEFKHKTKGISGKIAVDICQMTEISQASLQKSLDSPKNSLDLKKIHYLWNFCVEVCSFAWNDLVIYFITQKPLHHLQVC